MTPSVVALLLANALPIVGVLLLGWTVFPLVLIYWLENVVVGGYNVAKLLLVLLKTAADLRAHKAERARFAAGDRLDAEVETVYP